MDTNGQSLWSLCIVAGLLLAISSSSAVAQEPHVEFSGGYSLLHVNSASSNFPIGWFGSGGGRVALGKFRKDWFGLVGEVSRNQKTFNPLGFELRLTALSVRGGAKFVAHEWNKLTPFAQFVVGIAREGVHSEPWQINGSMTHFAYQPGGGVDLGVTSRFAVRAGVNWRLIDFKGQPIWRPGSQLHFVAGVVWKK